MSERTVRVRVAERLAALMGTLGFAWSGLTTPMQYHSASAEGRPQDSAECVVPPDSLLIEFVDTTVISTDSLRGVGSRANTQLPQVPKESVSVVTNEATCHRARIAMGLARAVPDSTAIAAVYLVRVGPTRYVVTDTGSYVGEFQIHITFDSAFSLPPLAIWGQ